MNDHDPEFAGGVGPSALAWGQASYLDRAALLRERLLQHQERHPQLPQAVLLAWTGTLGWSRAVIRLGNLPWLLLLLVGTWLLARELSEPRLALLAAFLVGTLPVVQHMSRKWFPHFFAAAAAPLAMALVLIALRQARSGGVKSWVWVALGVVQGLRLHLHPIGAPDVAITSALLLVGLWLSRQHIAALPWRGLLGAASLAAVLGAPAVFAGATHEGGIGFSEYLRMVSGYLSPRDLSLHRLPLALGAAILPGAALCVVLPGLVGLGVAGRPGLARLGTRLVAARVALQIPLILVTVGNGGFLADWMLLAPDCVVLCALGLGRLTERSGAGRWLYGAAIAQGVVTLLVPLGLGLAAPNALAAPPPGSALWGRSEHGGLYNTHHIPLRAPQAGAMLAAALGSPTRMLGVEDLTLATIGCDIPPGTSWQAPADGVHFGATPGTDPLEAAWGLTPEWQRGRTEGQKVSLVRLWRVSVEPEDCVVSGAEREALIASAAEHLTKTRGADAHPVQDLAQWFVAAPRPSAEPEPGYLSAAILLVH